MRIFKKLSLISIVITSTIFSGSAFSLATNCSALITGDALTAKFNVTSLTANIPSGDIITSAMTSPSSISCTFTKGSPTENSLYFVNMMNTYSKNLLINSGVDVVMQNSVISSNPITITGESGQRMYLGAYTPPPDWPSYQANIAFLYEFEIIKNPNPIKSFDTGVVLIGRHYNYLREDVGAPIYARFIGVLTNLCPAPNIYINPENGGMVNFGSISPQNIKTTPLAKVFRVGLSIEPTCKTGLNVSFTFDINGNKTVGSQFLDLENGLKVGIVLSGNNIIFGQRTNIKTVQPNVNESIPFTATLSAIDGKTIQSGPFSKTIKIIASY